MSKSMVCQTYCLQLGGLHENDGQLRPQTRRTGLSAGSADITETTDMTKTTGSGVQTTGWGAPMYQVL